MKKEAAVLLLLTSESSDREIIFERRSSRVIQGGDSSFIGGHVDTGETPLEAIIREACEEASLAKEGLSSAVSETNVFRRPVFCPH